ncbi:MAG: hypothetical protein INR68_08945 [Methylobacterium mesophilicum]|nr:hypothetical protein [Methylobacterium mesophilicum]
MDEAAELANLEAEAIRLRIVINQREAEFRSNLAAAGPVLLDIGSNAFRERLEAVERRIAKLKFGPLRSV